MQRVLTQPPDPARFLGLSVSRPPAQAASSDNESRVTHTAKGLSLRSSFATRRPLRVHCETESNQTFANRLHSANYSLAQPPGDLESAGRTLPVPRTLIPGCTDRTFHFTPTIAPVLRGARDRSFTQRVSPQQGAVVFGPSQSAARHFSLHGSPLLPSRVSR
jgi:hypothetical protein